MTLAYIADDAVGKCDAVAPVRAAPYEYRCMRFDLLKALVAPSLDGESNVALRAHPPADVADIDANPLRRSSWLLQKRPRVDRTFAANVDAEMQVGRCGASVAAIADGTDAVARLDPVAFAHVLRLKMREVQPKVSLTIIEPDDIASELPYGKVWRNTHFSRTFVLPGFAQQSALPIIMRLTSISINTVY